MTSSSAGALSPGNPSDRPRSHGAELGRAETTLAAGAAPLGDGDRHFVVRPVSVAADPARYPAQHARTLAADLDYPLVGTTIEARLMLLDGVHRLLKARLLGISTVRVRVLSVDRIDEIRIR